MKNLTYKIRYSVSMSLLTLMTICVSLTTFSQHSVAQVDPSKVPKWPSMPYAQPFDGTQLKPQGFIRVRGNQFVDQNDNTFVFKGVSIAAPDRLVTIGQWKKSLFEELKEWGVNTIRLPIHPVGWRLTGMTQYAEIIDEAVIWANDLGIYLIIDWHSIGYLPAGLFQHPMYETTEQETMRFWQFVSARYVNIPTVAVYEIFNEPTDIGGKAGKADWIQWKAFNEKVIDVIYAHDLNVIPLVAGFDWAYNLTPVLANPVERKGIAYASHPYPQKERPAIRSEETLFPLWEQKWGHVANTYPIIATELGWVSPDGYGAHIPVKDDGSYGPMIIKYMNKKGVSWVAWCFDPQWSPTMIEDWDFTPTQQGQFFKEVFQGKR